MRLVERSERALQGRLGLEPTQFRLPPRLHEGSRNGGILLGGRQRVLSEDEAPVASFGFGVGEGQIEPEIGTRLRFAPPGGVQFGPPDPDAGGPLAAELQGLA